MCKPYEQPGTLVMPVKVSKVAGYPLDALDAGSHSIAKLECKTRRSTAHIVVAADDIRSTSSVTAWQNWNVDKLIPQRGSSRSENRRRFEDLGNPGWAHT